MPAAGAAGQSPAADAAKAYPMRPLRIVVPNTAGSGLDAVSRLVGRKLTDAWGQQVVIDNRAGASGNIAMEIASRAMPDMFRSMTGINIVHVPYKVTTPVYPNASRENAGRD